MEASLEVEDDVFLADLSKRIALLLMDDDNATDTDTSRSSHGCCSSVSLQALSHAYSPVPVVSEGNGTKVSKGTGVFIPRSPLPRKKSRSGWFSSSNQPKYHKQNSDKSRISNL